MERNRIKDYLDATPPRDPAAAADEADEPWEPVPFEIHHRGDCPLDCPYCHKAHGGEG